MSVITPASEYNSTERVNAVTYKVLFEEIRRATEILLSRKDLSEVLHILSETPSPNEKLPPGLGRILLVEYYFLLFSIF